MALSDINNKIVSSISSTVTKSTIINGIGYLLVGMFIIGLCGWAFWIYLEKKKYNKKIKAYGIIHGYFHHTYTDSAKTTKIGKGGFEILYLKKAKTWKIAHGARTGMNEYTFYILPDGYWYPGQISADLKTLDKNAGLISVITTNPSMRSQYTSLEKQIDSMHGDKQGFWNKYGNWVMSISFIVIMGVFVWLTFREVSSFLGSGSALADRMNDLAESMNKLAVNLNDNKKSGLITP